MALPWGFVTILFGIAYGALRKGKQDKGRIFSQGILIGLVLGLVLSVLGALTGNPVITFLAIGGALGIIVFSIILSLFFILGVWIGDLITGAKGKPQ
jgi:hypothetical protein